MERREFLSKFAGGAAIAAVPVAVSGAAHLIANDSKDSLERLKLETKARVEALEKDFENLNRQHKRTLKIIGVVAGATIGIDLVSLM